MRFQFDSVVVFGMSHFIKNDNICDRRFSVEDNILLRWLKVSCDVQIQIFKICIDDRNGICELTLRYSTLGVYHVRYIKDLKFMYEIPVCF